MLKYGHVLRKDNNDLVQKCIEYVVDGVRPRGRPKKTWSEVVERDCQAKQLCRCYGLWEIEKVN